MSDENESELDPILAGLFKEERAREDAPLDAKKRIFDRLETSFTPPTPPNSGGSGNGGTLLKLLGALVVGGAMGGGIVSVMQKPQIVYVDRVAASSTATQQATSASAETAMALASATRVDAEPVPSASASASPQASSTDRSLAAERAILDVARTALGRGDGTHALEAVDRHAKEFPRGQMTEEREALAVQALAKMGRKSEAQSRGAQFKKRYPNSVLLVVIDAALQSVE